MKENLRVVNCCNHVVSVYENAVFDPAVKGCRGGNKVISFQPSGYIASALSTVEALPDMDMDGVKVPIRKRNFASVTDLPEENCLYIVSSLYATASKELGRDTSRLLVPHGDVVNEDGKKIGCTGLIRVSA